MMNVSIDLPTEHDTEKRAAQLSLCLQAPLILTFKGEIGVGKTTFIRALLKSLGVGVAIKSPTFSLVESYQGIDLQIHHFDLYRIHDLSELDYIGFRDYFGDHAICCIEWPERAGSYLSSTDIQFTLNLKGAGREMTISAVSSAGMEVLSCLLGGS